MITRTRALLGLLAAVLVVGLIRPKRHAVAQNPTPPPGLEKIQNFVFIMQENRSFDHYFGTYPGAEGIPPGVCLRNPQGPCVAPFHTSALVNYGGQHFNSSVIAAINGGLMDGFVPLGTPSPGDVMSWHDYNEISNYWIYSTPMLTDRTSV